MPLTPMEPSAWQVLCLDVLQAPLLGSRGVAPGVKQNTGAGQGEPRRHGRSQRCMGPNPGSKAGR